MQKVEGSNPFSRFARSGSGLRRCLGGPAGRGPGRQFPGRVPIGSSEVACLDDCLLRQRAVASPVRELEQPLSDTQAGCSIAEGADHSGQLVAGDRRRPVTAEAVGPGRADVSSSGVNPDA